MKSKTHPRQWCYTSRQPLRCCWWGQAVGWARKEAGIGHRAIPRWLVTDPLVSQGPALVINVSALQFGLLRLGQRATSSIQIQNISQLPAVWHMKESLVCLEERREDVSWALLAPRVPSFPPSSQFICVVLNCEICACAFRALSLREGKPAW